jgi:biotin transporter BioY
MAVVIAFGIKIAKNRKILALSLSIAVAILVCYFLGTVWFLIINPGMTFYKVLQLCVFPFAIFDIGKGVLVILLTKALEKTAPKLIMG